MTWLLIRLLLDSRIIESIPIPWPTQTNLGECQGLAARACFRNREPHVESSYRVCAENELCELKIIPYFPYYLLMCVPQTHWLCIIITHTVIYFCGTLRAPCPIQPQRIYVYLKKIKCKHHRERSYIQIRSSWVKRQKQQHPMSYMNMSTYKIWLRLWNSECLSFGKLKMNKQTTTITTYIWNGLGTSMSEQKKAARYVEDRVCSNVRDW